MIETQNAGLRFLDGTMAAVELDELPGGQFRIISPNRTPQVVPTGVPNPRALAGPEGQPRISNERA
jgi:hypothetical protein